MLLTDAQLFVFLALVAVALAWVVWPVVDSATESWEQKRIVQRNQRRALTAYQLFLETPDHDEYEA